MDKKSVFIRSLSYIEPAIAIAMRKTLFIVNLFFFSAILNGQTVIELIKQVQRSQQKLQSASYSLVRKDTLVTGTTRIIKGKVKLTVLPTDTIFGFKFWAIKDGVKHESIYDGSAAFDIDHDKKQYNTISDPAWFPHFLDNYGGQVVLTQLVKIDTSGTVDFKLSQDATYYYLRMTLPDIKQYEVSNRSKTLVIDKKLLLPVGMIFRQETLGKIQDLNYRIEKIEIDNPSLSYNFSALRYPNDYTREEGQRDNKMVTLKDQAAPSFSLTSFDGNTVSSGQFKGKLVLLDFWEVWCGPCMESMPKVQQSFEKYKSKGLEVYGVVHEKEYLDAAKLLVQKRKISFPMLLGDEQSRKKYNINGVPLYVLINKEGKIIMVSQSFSPLLEEEIQKNL